MRYFLAKIIYNNGTVSHRLVQAESKEQAEEKAKNEYGWMAKIVVEETLI
jgi:hypothetical protein